VEKAVALLPAETSLGQRTNALWMGTHVVTALQEHSWSGTGRETEFGKVSDRLKTQTTGNGILSAAYGDSAISSWKVTLLLVVAIFAINVLCTGPALILSLFLWHSPSD